MLSQLSVFSTNHPIATILAALVAILCINFILPWLRARRAALLHGCVDPVSYPHIDWLLGSDLLALRKNALRLGRLKRLYLAQHRALGETWQEIADGGKCINTIAAENLRYIYALHASAFQKANNSSQAARLLFGHGILTADGDEWRWMRKMITPTFSKYEGATMEILEGHVDAFMSNLPSDGGEFDAQVLLKKLFLDLATDFLFGTPLGMQMPSAKSKAEAFLRTMDSTLLGMNKRRQGISFTSLRLWLLDSSYKQDVAAVHDFIDTHVRDALDRTKSSPIPTSRFVLAESLARQTRDPVYLRGILLQCFLPARDQPAILLSNTLFELSRHPENWRRLRTLALSVPHSEETSFQKLSSLFPIRYAILEALRLHGPGGANKRRAAQDLILPVGGGPEGNAPVFVAKGTLVVTHFPVMHRSKEYWGADADEFRPERFLERKIKLTKTELADREGSSERMTPSELAGDHADIFGWEFKPFLAGPRTCPAKDQTIVQMTYVIMRLLKQFEDIECADEVREFVEMARLTTESRNGAKIRLRAGNNANE